MMHSKVTHYGLRIFSVPLVNSINCHKTRPAREPCSSESRNRRLCARIGWHVLGHRTTWQCVRRAPTGCICSSYAEATSRSGRHARTVPARISNNTPNLRQLLVTPTKNTFAASGFGRGAKLFISPHPGKLNGLIPVGLRQAGAILRKRAWIVSDMTKRLAGFCFMLQFLLSFIITFFAIRRFKAPS
jgi:hypothetical protein